MRNRLRDFLHGVLATMLLSAACSAQAAPSIYVPFSQLNLARTQYTGLWLADTGNLGAAPIQLSNQPLDGNAGGSTVTAVLSSWRLTAGEATNMRPQLVVFGLGGHLYKANLTGNPTVQTFSNGSYAELCSLLPLDPESYNPSTSYVQATVEPVGSTDSCASGLSVQTWLISAGADGTVAPTVEPANWLVLGAFTNSDGSFNRWLVRDGSSVLSYIENFSSPMTLLTNLPIGSGLQVLGHLNGNFMLVSSANSSTDHFDTFYHVTPSQGNQITTLAYSLTSPCATAGFSVAAVPDTGPHLLLISEPTDTGYAVLWAPVGGGPLSVSYLDSSGSVCAGVAGETASAGYVALNAVDLGTGTYPVLSVKETGPETQTPLVLAGSGSVSASVTYTINGHEWIQEDDFSGSTDVLSMLVVNSDGTVLQTYGNTRLAQDLFQGFYLGGMDNADRSYVYLYGSTNAGSCSAGTLTAINAASFAATAIAGLPADSCMAQGYGFPPASVGDLQEPAGHSPIEIDPVGGRLYILLGPVSNGSFINQAGVFGYPFM